MSQCINCDAGTITTEEGKSECDHCPVGHHNPHQGKSECVECDSNEIAVQEVLGGIARGEFGLLAATNATRCYECPAGKYLEEMMSATFCGVFPGNGWGHIETPILLGCIPVVVQDEILTPWENVLNFTSFAIRLPRNQLHRMIDILKAIPQERIKAMQAKLSVVWERFTFSSLVKAEASRSCTEQPGAHDCRELQRQLRGSNGQEVTGRDAVDTLMHVLNARLVERERKQARYG